VQDNSENKLKQSAHTLETDELLKLLEETEVKTDEPVQFEDDVLNFIATFTIEPGNEKIKQHTLYLIYKAWSQNPLKKMVFLNKMRNYFESCQVSGSAGYLINQNAIKLTHSAYKYFSNRNIRINSKAWAKHFENFLKFHALDKGNFWIHQEILYFIYDKFCYATGLANHSSKHFSKPTFFIYCQLYLPTKKTKKGILYGVTDNIQNFFQIGQLERMQKEYEKEKKKPKKRKRKTKSRTKAQS